MRKLTLRTEHLSELEPGDLERVAVAAATRDGKCRSIGSECETGVGCLLTSDICPTGAGCA